MLFISFAVTIFLCIATAHGDSVEVTVRANGYLWSANKTWLESAENLNTLLRDSYNLGNTPKDARLRIYFLAESAQKLQLSFNIKLQVSQAQLRVSVWKSGSTNKFIDEYDSTCRNCKSSQRLYIGRVSIKQPGYHFLEITSDDLSLKKIYRGIESAVFESQGPVEVKANVGNEDGDVWLTIPSLDVTYLTRPFGGIKSAYTKLLVPKGRDIPGTFYMAIGHNDGYFGIQVNSPTERRILFSIWSNFDTDDPDKVPEDYKVQFVKKGKNVVVKNFNNEGTGAQSFTEYDWKTDIWYKFLLTAEKSGDDNTIFTAYFQAPEFDGFRLIASWDKPKTGGKLMSGLSGFIEQFTYEQLGFLKRQSLVDGPWFKTEDKDWTESHGVSLRTTASEDAHQRYDIDAKYNGRILELSDGGFDVVYNSSLFSKNLYRKVEGSPPVIHFESEP